jgi:hypothetical protein
MLCRSFQDLKIAQITIMPLKAIHASAFSMGPGLSRPGGVAFVIDIQVQGIPGLAPGGPGLKSGSIRHNDVNGVVVGVEALFHVSCSKKIKRAKKQAPLHTSRYLPSVLHNEPVFYNRHKRFYTPCHPRYIPMHFPKADFSKRG